jgi:hypothetical protein
MSGGWRMRCCARRSSPHVSRGGDQPWHGQWLRTQTETSTVTTVKLSEEGGALVLRALELEGRADRLVVDDRAVDVPAHGVVTALLNANGLRRSDGLER